MLIKGSSTSTYCKLSIHKSLQGCYNKNLCKEDEQVTTKHLVYTALMTAIICILGIVPSVPLPFMPVPIVLQNIGIFWQELF